LKSNSAAALQFADVLKQEVGQILKIELPDRDDAQDAAVAGDESFRTRRKAVPGIRSECLEWGYEQRLYATIDDHPTDLSALCLSGGGIRSATFALGVLQGLARFGLLNRFHYLSSVSGGGYIASWLSAWRRTQNDSTEFSALNRSMWTGREPPEIKGIRADSNYLTPQLGLLSADTWTVLTLYVRNVVLNWALFMPFFMGCFFLPRLCAAILAAVAGETAFRMGCLFGMIFVVAGLAFGVYGRFRRQKGWLNQRRFLFLVLGFLVLSGASFTIAAVSAATLGPQSVWVSIGFPAWMSPHGMGPTALGLLHGGVVGFVAYFTAWALGRAASWRYLTPPERQIEWIDVFFWSASGALVGVLSAVGISVIAEQVSEPRAAAVLGLSGFVLAYFLGELVYVGLASFSRKADMDREWLARSSGWLGATALAWGLFSSVALYAPGVLSDVRMRIATLLGGVLAGVVTGSLGWSTFTTATAAASKAAQTLKGVSLMRLASVAAVVFALLAASLLSLLDQMLEGIFPDLPLCVIDAGFMIGLVLVAASLSLAINVNRFSMHALYRNRLVRAFLGSARATRRNPDPYTGFDPDDNARLAETRPLEQATSGGGWKLFHVINAALNVVSSDNPAWQERKAESFTMTPLHCGNPYVGYQATADYAGKKNGGLTLGTAMAISGAAVSPNQGYNSAPLVGFLLMLFNVRLGWWLGSPRLKCSSREGPFFSLSPALRELVGDTTDQAKWIYLSDGGHFENLGLYEMVRRRCRRIVVSDAGCDPTFNFEDLGNAVRKIYIDLGVSIVFESLEIKPRQHPPAPGLRFAIGQIHYPNSDRPGWLLYLKPTYQETTERVDIRSYAIAHDKFPHESTTDQWFSESQLESYRALGATVAEYMCSGGKAVPPGATPAPLDLDGLYTTALGLMRRDVSRLQSASAARRQAPRGR
jgi:hypothetical protein